MTDDDTTEPDQHFHDAAWFAHQIGMSIDWVRHNTKRLPRHKIGNRVKFDDHCVAIYREQTFQHPEDMRRTQRSRARKK